MIAAATAQLEPFLRPGEKLLWTGRPDPSKRFTKADVLLVPFSILWAGFAVFWETAVIVDGAGWFFTLWGIPFVTAGLYLTVGRFAWKARQKRRTVYGVTQERAIAVVNGRSVRDAPLRLVPVSLDLARDGRHLSVTFGNGGAGRAGGVWGGWSAWNSQALANTGWPGAGGSLGFYDVDDPAGLRAALDQARTM